MTTRNWILTVAIVFPACAAQPLPAPDASPIHGLVQAARADAAKRSGLAPMQLQLVLAEVVTWPNGSLGCPRPCMLYTDALVPGYRVKLKVGNQLWDYHASERGGGPVLCPPGQSQEPGPGGRD